MLFSNQTFIIHKISVNQIDTNLANTNYFYVKILEIKIEFEKLHQPQYHDRH